MKNVIILIFLFNSTISNGISQGIYSDQSLANIDNPGNLSIEKRSLDSSELLAHYPLENHANDITGQQNSIELTNMPFIENSVYSGGIYIGSYPEEGTLLKTPDYENWDTTSFAISVEFKVNEIYDVEMPVIVGGEGYRWFGIYLFDDGTIGLKYNNYDFVYSNISYAPNIWHDALISYENTTAKLFLDNKFACEVSYIPNTGGEKHIVNTDFSIGRVFKGYLKNLKIYKTSLPHYFINDLTESIDYKVYPNPFNEYLIIELKSDYAQNATIEFHDQYGQLIEIIDSIIISADTQKITFKPKHLKQGLYFLKIATNDNNHKIIKVVSLNN